MADDSNNTPSESLQYVVEELGDAISFEMRRTDDDGIRSEVSRRPMVGARR
jgi:hypothetical protein